MMKIKKISDWKAIDQDICMFGGSDSMNLKQVRPDLEPVLPGAGFGCSAVDGGEDREELGNGDG